MIEACRALSAGVKSVLPDVQTVLMPISDGGDGLIDALLAAKGGKLVSVSVVGPMGERRKAHFAWLPGRIAVVEMARASGLALVPRGKRDVMRATSYGTGQLIDAALRKGARTIFVGMGGSATNDGGAGMAQALGAQLLDRNGLAIERGAQALLGLERIELGDLKKRLRGVRVIAVSDVSNPLLGPRGSARVFGPQKGATRAQIRALDKALTRYARLIKRDRGIDIAQRPGAGAAGGLGAGLLAFLGAKVVPGAAFVLEQVGAREKLAAAGAALTGEGKLDMTSFFGKAPVEFARLASRANVPTACVCGSLDGRLASQLRAAGIRETATLAEAGARGEDSVKRAAFWARKAAAVAVTRLLLAGTLLGMVSSSRAAVHEELGAIDQLYLHRDQGKKLDETVAKLNALLKEDPNNPELLWRLGRSLVRVGENQAKKKDKIDTYQRAEDTIRKSVELAPKVAVSHFWLGVAMGRRGESRGITNSMFIVGPLKQEMRTTIELDPTYGGAHHVLGEMYKQLPFFAGGSKKKALAEFEAALKLSPDYAVNYVSLAQAYIDAGEKEKARAVLDRLFALKNPSDPAEYPDNIKDGKELLEKLKP